MPYKDRNFDIKMENYATVYVTVDSITLWSCDAVLQVAKCGLDRIP